MSTVDNVFSFPSMVADTAIRYGVVSSEPDFVQFIPEYFADSNATDDDDIKKRVFLDWAIDRKRFSFHNFKALESIINVYPQSTIFCLTQMHNDSATRSGPLAISVLARQLGKYVKMGYNFEMRDYARKLPAHIESIAPTYRMRWLLQCSAQKGVDGNCAPPFHFSVFTRLSHMWATGGIFTDLSHYFLGAIDNPVVKNVSLLLLLFDAVFLIFSAHYSQGYSIVSFCSHRNEMKKNLSSKTNGTRSETNYVFGCITSSIFVFNKPKSDVILCILRKYDESPFMKCVSSDVLHEGANCVRVFFRSVLQNFLLVMI